MEWIPIPIPIVKARPTTDRTEPNAGVIDERVCACVKLLRLLATA